MAEIDAEIMASERKRYLAHEISRNLNGRSEYGFRASVGTSAKQSGRKPECIRL